MTTDRRKWGLYASFRNEFGKKSREARLVRTTLKSVPGYNEPFRALEKTLFQLEKDGVALSLKARKDALLDAKCKCAEEYAWQKSMHLLPEQAWKPMFAGEEVIWTNFRSHDESYNSYDHYTKRTVINHHMTDKEENEFREKFWIHFQDPYCDGRDCTGAPFTSYMKFLRCKDRTVILHRVNLDL